MILASVAVRAQQDGFIEGTVTGETGTPLPGANITVTSSTGEYETGTAAVAEGRFRIAVPEDLPGVDFAKVGVARSNAVVRGFNNVFSGTLLTLTDNRIARVPSLRVNAFNFIPLTNDDVERIEVVLGPGSALYGPNSADGVMHVITRSPFASQGTSVNVGMGERSLRQTGFRHAGALGDRLGYKVSASTTRGRSGNTPTRRRRRPGN